MKPSWPNPPLNSDPACIVFRSFSSPCVLGSAQRFGVSGAGYASRGLQLHGRIREDRGEGPFRFRGRVLAHFLPPPSCRKYLEHRPSHQGVRVFADPGSNKFKSRPYLEFFKASPERGSLSRDARGTTHGIHGHPRLMTSRGFSIGRVGEPLVFRRPPGNYLGIQGDRVQPVHRRIQARNGSLNSQFHWVLRTLRQLPAHGSRAPGQVRGRSVGTGGLPRFR